MVQQAKNPTSIHEDVGTIPGLARQVKLSGVAMTCGIGRIRGSDPALLWLWCRLAAAALIRPPGWELPYATGEVIKKIIVKKKKTEKRKRILKCLRRDWEGSLVNPPPQKKNQ